MKRKMFFILCVLFTFVLLGCGGKSATSKLSSRLEDIASVFEQGGLTTVNKIEPAYEMIGAIDGFKYAGNSIEVYEYDVKSESYKKLSKDGTVTLTGFDMTLKASAIKGQYVLFCEDAENKEEIISAFNEIK